MAVAFRERYSTAIQCVNHTAIPKIKLYMAENTTSTSDSSFSLQREENLFQVRLNSVLEQKCDNPEFDVEQLASSLQVSKARLYKLTMALTGLSPAKLIVSFRINKAVNLLRESNSPVKEIAWQSGFQRHAGFCRSFFQEFRCSPSRFRSQYIDEQAAEPFSWELPIDEENLVQLLSLARQHNWLARFLRAVLSDLGNATFSVNQLSALLCISNSSLNRRMKEILGLSPQRFIRNLRLQYASELLALKTESVSQIAHKAGFFDHAHLCRCFKPVFHCQPSAYNNANVRFLSVEWLRDNLPDKTGK
jgi:AraC-like DNA-binding protein